MGFLFILIQPSSIIAQQSPAKIVAGDPDVSNLIAQLGHDQYSIRLEAESKILKLGASAILALRAASGYQQQNHAPDVEISLRCQRILKIIERQNFQRRVKEFLVEKEEDPGLPHWELFSQTVGTTRSARRLFISMYESQPRLLNACLKSPEKAQTEYRDALRRSLYVSSYSNSDRVLGNLAALMFSCLVELPGNTGLPQKISVDPSDFGKFKKTLTLGITQTLITNTQNDRTIHRLLESWLAQMPTEDIPSQMSRLEIVKTYQLEAFEQFAIQTLVATELPLRLRRLSLEVIETIGKQKSVPQLQNVFQDQTVIGRFNLNRPQKGTPPEFIDVYFCDLALAVAIRISGRDLIEFGFPSSVIQDGKINVARAGFPSQLARSEAFKKWRQAIAE